ncbi:cell envelope integrity protein CreD [Chitinophaga pendula]|uniref:cell envelope integrity protein CreD n=1 Tax=Chitinophaga TaxID=79328 RepID=UPI000BAE93C9|nr:MULTISPECIES: cell envelope integrity protein CreD [Chitinophaga]ASZ10027.1 cell envelope integrity protein CreD [Chitinophaga sp. MD30]UCJ07025.1 cell envelope integrity protein CreD [Chitinophaga pendula]
MDTTQLPGKNNFFQKYGYAVKAVLIGVLVLMLLIPTVMIMAIINERESRHNEAAAEISDRWAKEQTITGPVLIIPYIIKPVSVADSTVRQENRLSYAYFLPETLDINGNILPEIRKRGIYQVPVYNSNIRLSGSFKPLSSADQTIPTEVLITKDAYLVIGVSDMRGIGNQVQLQWNGQPLAFNPGTAGGNLFTNGIQAKVPVTVTDSGNVHFSVNIALKGSGQISFSPVGKTTRLQMASSWNSPSFAGAFLPEKHQIDDKGFNASWLVTNMNRSFPQSWQLNDKYDIHSADFGVKLYMSVDGYQKSMRAVKYAILIIGLTFLVFYFIELLQHQSVHPLQYILIGLALCIFYTLLIALAEQLGFNIAYLIAASLTIGLVTLYTASVFTNKWTSFGIGGAMLTLYGFIFIIIRSEDQALLMGSLGLFIILAIVMFFSRKIKWDTLGARI